MPSDSPPIPLSYLIKQAHMRIARSARRLHSRRHVPTG